MNVFVLIFLLIIPAPLPVNDLRIRNKPQGSKYQWYKNKFRNKGRKYTKTQLRKRRYTK